LDYALVQPLQSLEIIMSVVIILMLASLGVGLVFVIAFVWSVRNGQYEDTLTPAMRVLVDDAAPSAPAESNGGRTVRASGAGPRLGKMGPMTGRLEDVDFIGKQPRTVVVAAPAGGAVHKPEQ
jgi:cbb3-type cytochrome oxidase maturation protein